MAYRLPLAADRFARRVAHPAVTNSAVSSICCRDWYGPRSLTGTSTFSINDGGSSAAKSCVRGWQTAIHPEDLPELLERWRSILASCEPGEMHAYSTSTASKESGLNHTTREADNGIVLAR
jgi:hypothetical protein